MRSAALIALLVLASCREPAPATAAIRTLKAEFPAQAARVLRPPPAHGPRLRVPTRAGQAMRLEVGDFGIDVVELGATGRIDTTADGLVVHARAGGTVFWTSTANGFEEWLLVEPAAVQAERVVVAQWKVSGAQLRPMGETVAVLDLRGVRRMVVSAPEAFSDGRKVPAWLEADGDTLSISVASADVRGRVLVDPLWTVVGMMSNLRVLAQSTLLPGGKVLMTGGQGMPPEVEVFDPFTQTWALTTPLNRGRHCHTAVGLQDGRVLVLGGIAALASGGGQYSPTTELYNPVSATWSAGAPMLASRCFATATLLSNGTVLVAGGRQGSGPLAELYDPTTNTWSPTGPMQDDRFQHTATLLPDGRVLAVTGTTPQSAAGGTDTTELYDPATNSWRDAGVLIQRRTNHTASLVQGGKVVVAGGWIYWGNGFLTSVEIYDSDAGTWSPGPPTAEAHVESPWVSLGSGEPLVIGGYASEATESYEPATNSWSSRGKLATPHSQGTATLLLDGRVLVAGGYDLKSEVFDPTLGRTCSTGASCISGLCVDGFCCDSACGGACDRCDLPGLAGVCTPIDAGTIGTSSCAPYACNGESGACPTACTDDLHCAPTHFCLNGGCVPNGTGPQAALCRKAAQCASGFCADGRCCNEACTASCTSCDLPGSEGVCGHALPNTKDTTCSAFKCNPADAGCLTVCGSAADCQAGFFCADGGCEVLRPLGAGCVQAGDCADNHCTQGTCCQNDCPFPCGACVGPGFSCGPAPLGFDGGLGCAPFECDGTQLFCPSSCTSDAGCVPGRFCSGGHACLLPGEGATGIACTSHFQCATGACIDGFCCDTECGGEDRNDCQACSVARGATANGTCMLLSSATTCGPGRLPDGGLWGCDVHEYCTGVSPTCPTDLFADAGTLCHAPAGACDEPEYCVGNWPHCPDQHPRKPPGFVCRASTGACDPAEKCNGLEAECPVDGFAATTEVCRPAASACDAEELCSGSSAACPPDLSRANGEACGTALACTNGVCSSIPDAGVDGGAGGSGGAGGGTGGSGGSGGGSGGTGGSAGGSALVDAGASDGGSTDAGPGGGGTSGCGCSTAPETMLTWIAVVALVRRRRYGAAP